MKRCIDLTSHAKLVAHPLKLLRLVLPALIAEFVFFSSLLGDEPTPKVFAWSKIGAQLGSTIDLQPQLGLGLTNLNDLRFAGIHPSVNREVRSWNTINLNDLLSRFDANFPSSTQVSLTEFQTLGSFGASNTRRLWLTVEPWSYLDSRLSSADAPLPIEFERVYQDCCEARRPSYYRITLEKDSDLAIRSVSDSVDSRAKLVFELTDATGIKMNSREIRDSLGSIVFWDRLPVGEFLLSIHDTLYRGGPDFAFAFIGYRNHQPQITSVRDRWAAIASRVTERAAYLGVNRVPTRGEPESSNHDFKLLTHQLTLRPPSATWNSKYRESSVDSESPMPIAFPSCTEGLFETNDDEDWFEFQATSSTEVVVEVVSQRVGEVTDPLLVVYRVQRSGEATELVLIDKSDDLSVGGGNNSHFASRDPVLRFAAESGITYRILVRDQQRSKRYEPLPGYCLAVRPPAPDFALLVQPGIVNHDLAKLKSESKPMSLTAYREVGYAFASHIYRFDGFDLPIDVHVEGLPSKVHASETTIEVQDLVKHLVIHADADCDSSTQLIHFRGDASLSGRRISRWAHSAECFLGPIETEPVSSFSITDGFVLSIPSQQFVNGSFTIRTEKPLRVQAGETLNVPFAFQLPEGSERPKTIEAHDLPRDFNKVQVRWANDQSLEGHIELVIPNSAAPGVISFWVSAESKIKSTPGVAMKPEHKQLLSMIQEQPIENVLSELKLNRSELESVRQNLQALDTTAASQLTPTRLSSHTIRFEVVAKP